MSVFRVDKNNKLLDNAKKLRRNLTPQEKHLWYDFLQHYTEKIYKQRIIDDFIADFYCHKARLVIEIDGSHHYKRKSIVHDRERTKIINRYGIAVIRFSNRDIDYDFEKVCFEIDRIIKVRLLEINNT